MDTTKRTWLRRFAAAVLLMNAAILVTYAWLPSWRWRLFAEDRLVETATALFLLLSFLVAATALWRTRSPLYRLELAGAGALGLIAFLDEISFGARIFHLKMPAIEGGGEFDGAHDVLTVAWRAFTAQGPLLETLWAAGGLALTGLLLWTGRHLLKRGLDRLRTDTSYQLLLAFVSLLTSAMLVDMLGWHDVLEEMLELNGCLLLLAGVVVMAGARGWPGRPVIAAGIRPPSRTGTS
jgi:hypothetical protein